MPFTPMEVSQIADAAFIETCRYHPALVKRVRPDGNVVYTDLVSNMEETCHIFECGLRVLTAEEAQIWLREGPQDVDLDDEEVWWL